MSEKTSTLYQDFAKAQSSFDKIEKNREVAVKMKSGGTYKFKYADLEEVLNKTRPHLNKVGFGVSWTEEEGVMTCVLSHKDGYITSDMKMEGNAHDPQSKGSLSTYYRRYTYSNCVGVCAEEDNDASGFQQEFTAQSTKKNTSNYLSLKQQNLIHMLLERKYGGKEKIPPQILEAVPKLTTKGASEKIEQLKEETENPKKSEDGPGVTYTNEEIPF